VLVFYYIYDARISERVSLLLYIMEVGVSFASVTTSLMGCASIVALRNLIRGLNLLGVKCYFDYG
jgi:hypothetical protein